MAAVLLALLSCAARASAALARTDAGVRVMQIEVAAAGVSDGGLAEAEAEAEVEIENEAAHVVTGFAAALDADRCGPNNTVWDVGMNIGLDSKRYLEDGFCVHAIEADPTLVAKVSKSLAGPIAEGRLRIHNVAITPGHSMSELSFWTSKCNREWNSFTKEKACHKCPGRKGDNCKRQVVQAVPCGEFFEKYGTPLYIKLDIEGAEDGCYDALDARRAKSLSIPRFVSGEVSKSHPSERFHKLGYKNFKLVRQDSLMLKGGGSTSGGFGKHALDCAKQEKWRDYDSLRRAFHKLWLNGGVGDADPCPWNKDGRNWYDVHAALF